MTPKLRIVVTGFMTNKAIDDPRVATYSYMTPPGDHETMTEATARPRRTGWLANHQRVNSATRTGTIAPYHPMPRCGHKTMTTTKIACFPSLRLTTARSGEPNSLYIAWPRTIYKGSQVTLPRRWILETSFGQSLSTLLPLPLFLHAYPIVRTLEHSTEKHAFDLSLRLDVGLWSELV
jgi:hypothetical protein